MRIGPGFGFFLLLTTALCAQTRGTGSVVHPGGAGLPGVTRSLGSVVNPAQGGLVVPGSRGGGVHNRGVYAYPVFIGGYYPTPYLTTTDNLSQAPAATQAPANNITVVMPPQQPVTPVVINYNYGPGTPVPVPEQPVTRDQANASDDSANASEHYLIAFKDHTIYAATAYWVDNDTLHYFTSGNVHNQVSVALVDREFTQRLNKEAGLDVRIPAPAK